MLTRGDRWVNILTFVSSALDVSVICGRPDLRLLDGFLCALHPGSDFLEKGTMSDAKETGTVKWFDARKGYGFIQPDIGGSIFCHKTAYHGIQLHPLVGQVVTFTATWDISKMKIRAENVQIVGKTLHPMDARLNSTQTNTTSIRENWGQYPKTTDVRKGFGQYQYKD